MTGNKYIYLFGLIPIAMFLIAFFSAGGIDKVKEILLSPKDRLEKDISFDEGNVNMDISLTAKKNPAITLLKKCRVIYELSKDSYVDIDEKVLKSKEFIKIDPEVKGIAFSKKSNLSDFNISIPSGLKAIPLDKVKYLEEDTSAEKFKYLIVSQNGYCGWIQEYLLEDNK